MSPTEACVDWMCDEHLQWILIAADSVNLWSYRSSQIIPSWDQCFINTNSLEFKSLPQGITKSLRTDLILFIPTEQCYRSSSNKLFEATLDILTRENIHGEFRAKCHEAIFSVHCLNQSSDFYDGCFNLAETIVTPATTIATTTQRQNATTYGESTDKDSFQYQTVYNEKDSPTNQPAHTTFSSNHSMVILVPNNITGIDNLLLNTVKESVTNNQRFDDGSFFTRNDQSTTEDNPTVTNLDPMLYATTTKTSYETTEETSFMTVEDSLEDGQILSESTEGPITTGTGKVDDEAIDDDLLDNKSLSKNEISSTSNAKITSSSESTAQRYVSGFASNTSHVASSAPLLSSQETITKARASYLTPLLSSTTVSTLQLIPKTDFQRADTFIVVAAVVLAFVILLIGFCCIKGILAW